MDRIYRLMTTPWSVTPGTMASMRLVLASALKNGTFHELADMIRESPVECAYVSASGIPQFYNDADEPTPPGTVGVIELKGFLYRYKTDRAISALRDMCADPNIIGVVLSMDGPGGEVSGVDELAQVIRAAGKPVVAYVRGMACSAYYWLACACQRICCASGISDIGCVGVYTSYMNESEWYRQQGIDLRDIYADASDLKNEEYRAIAERDDESLMKERLAKINDAFCEAVAQGRSIAYDPQLPLFRGRTFMASDALPLGYIDEICPFDTVIEWVRGNSEARRWNFV